MSTPDVLGPALDELGATAIEPSRVMVLSEDEQWEVILVLSASLRTGLGGHLRDRIANGDTYHNEADELTRRTLRKRRLEEEIRRENKRIAELEQTVVEQLAELGMKSMKHEATGATLRRNDKVWIKYARDDLHTAEKAEVKAQAAAVMVAVGGDVADLVKPDYNGNTVSAFYREKYAAAVEEQLALPEHERRPVDPDELLPEALREYLRLDAQPHIEVRA